MSKVMTTNKFLDLVKRSGLIEEERLRKFFDGVKTQHGREVLEDQERLAELFVEADLLTKWQTDKMLAGKHKGFRLGKYKLLEQIGKGGMSSVYLAEHTLMRRKVAIKVLPQNRVEDASYLERFRLEARAVAKLDDPNIVRAYDIDNEGKVHYIVMEYVKGDDLHQMVSKHGALGPEVAADYIAQVANGLQHAHEQGLVHRDIKPANCLVDSHQTVKLLDLGLAKLKEDDMTSLTLANEENVLGTADYLAPEQALNSHAADSRADIYSLGCTLYFLLTGRPPFPEGTISERLLKHQTAEPDSVFKLRPDVPPSLVEVCGRMMAKKPDDRFQTAGEVAERLTDWLAERGRTLGGGQIKSDKEESGVGSGVFGRFALGPPTPTPSTGPSSETLSSSDRDTAKLIDGESGSIVEEDIGLAPLDEEEDEGAISGLEGTGAEQKDEASDSSIDLSSIEESVVATTSLVEEELHDPQEEAIARKVAQRAQYNPLKPPGYTPPSQSPPWGLIVGIVVGAMVLVGIVLSFLL